MIAREAASSWWGGVEPKQRWILAGVAAAVIVAILAWANLYGTDPSYVTLFSSLDSRDAAEIIEQLEREGVDYLLDRGSSRVLVPEREVHRLRLLLAAQGMPRGGVVGFELMDTTRLGVTDFDRRINYHRALQGELTRTILQISGVDSARVHLAIPEPSLFVADTRQPTAVVMIKLRSLVDLTPIQVRGMKHLIAQSIEGMDMDNVTILDYSGRVLGTEVNAAHGGISAGYIDAQVSFEREMEQRLKSLLEMFLGQGNVACQVTADLNFDQTTIARTLYEPVEGGGGLARSVYRLEEVFVGTEGGGEVPGTVPNIPTYPAAGNGGGDSRYERTEITENYELNAIFEETVLAPGGIKRLSVAVVANQDLTPEQHAAITQTVAAAIGYSELRSDLITVHGIPFDTSLADQIKEQLVEEERWREQSAAQGQLRTIIVAGVILVLTVVLLLAFVFSRRKVPVAIEPIPISSMTTDTTDFSGISEKRVQEGVARLARQDPSTVAQLLKSWLAEEGRS